MKKLIPVFLCIACVALAAPRGRFNTIQIDNVVVGDVVGDNVSNISGFDNGTFNSVYINSNWTPATKTTACTKGRVGGDNVYLYYCWSDNNIIRVPYDNTW